MHQESACQQTELQKSQAVWGDEFSVSFVALRERSDSSSLFFKAHSTCSLNNLRRFSRISRIASPTDSS
jgi:hypothetical protein